MKKQQNKKKQKICKNCKSDRMYVSKSVIQDGCCDTVYRCWDCNHPEIRRSCLDGIPLGEGWDDENN